jgi:hypothetical protein
MNDILLAVNGTLMRGFALNNKMLSMNAEFMRVAKTCNRYRLWSIDDQYPAMLRDENLGANIDLEIWKLSSDALLEVLKGEPPGLCLGKIELIDGEWVLGILGEPYICEGRKEITKWGGWRKYHVVERT